MTRLLNLLTAGSLLLCVAALALWVGTHRAAMGFEFGYRGIRWHAASGGGWLSLDNSPQRALEQARYDQQRRQVLAQLRAGIPSLPVASGPADAAYAEQRRQARALDSNINSRLAALGPPLPAARYSLPHAGVAAVTALPAVLQVLYRRWRLRTASRAARPVPHVRLRPDGERQRRLPRVWEANAQCRMKDAE